MAYNPLQYYNYYNMYGQMPQVQGGYTQAVQPAGQTYQAPQMSQMSLPTIHADIVQVENEAAAENYPVGPGAAQMMIAKDDSFIAVKTAAINGQYNLDVFVKRPPIPQKAPFNPSEYIRRDELPELLAAALTELQGEKTRSSPEYGSQKQQRRSTESSGKSGER